MKTWKAVLISFSSKDKVVNLEVESQTLNPFKETADTESAVFL